MEHPSDESLSSSDPKATVRQVASDRPSGTMNLDDLAQSTWALISDLAIQPVTRFFLGLNAGDRSVLYVLLAIAAVLGFAIGRRRTSTNGGRRIFGAWRFPSFQNSGEARVSRVLLSHFGAPDYHLMNHVTLQMDDGTTQVDHILVSRFGVFVIETKDYNGWIFANASAATWTQVLYRRRSKFQNPLLQNYRHVRAVQDLLDCLPPEAIKSVVVFSGDAEFKTDIPSGVITIAQLPEHLRQHTPAVMSRDRQQFCVGRLETARLAISGKTDIEHVEGLARRFGASAV